MNFRHFALDRIQGLPDIRFHLFAIKMVLSEPMFGREVEREGSVFHSEFYSIPGISFTVKEIRK